MVSLPILFRAEVNYSIVCKDIFSKNVQVHNYSFSFSGLLKEEIIDDEIHLNPSHSDGWNNRNSTVINTPRFTSIKSKVSEPN